MANPTEGPFPLGPDVPQFGDPELLPKPDLERPSKERMPFGPSGERLPTGPELPVGYLQAPDVEGLPWFRRRGDEWTDAPFRDIVRLFLSGFLAARPWVKRWDVTERASAPRMSIPRLPSGEHYLVLGVKDAAGVRYEAVGVFPPDRRAQGPATAILELMAAAIDVQV